MDNIFSGSISIRRLVISCTARAKSGSVSQITCSIIILISMESWSSVFTTWVKVYSRTTDGENSTMYVSTSKEAFFVCGSSLDSVISNAGRIPSEDKVWKKIVELINRNDFWTTGGTKRDHGRLLSPTKKFWTSLPYQLSEFRFFIAFPALSDFLNDTNLHSDDTFSNNVHGHVFGRNVFREQIQILKNQQTSYV